MACNCNKKNDDSEIGSDPATWSPKSINWKLILLVLLILAFGWYFFLRSKGPDAFFNK
jgi:hypothetical protein